MIDLVGEITPGRMVLLAIGGGSGFICGVVAAFRNVKNGKVNWAGTAIWLSGTTGLWIALLAVLIPIFGDIFFRLDPSTRLIGRASPIGLAVLGVAIALGLYALRRARRKTYGVVEIIVALGTMGAIGGQLSRDTDQLLTALVGAMGAVYVLVRGLTNIADGTRDNDPLWLRRLLGLTSGSEPKP